MTDSEYEDAGGSDRAVGDGTVAWSRLSILTVEVRGFKGVAGRECRRYQAKTVSIPLISVPKHECEQKCSYVLLCPYFVGSDDAPATANRGEEKKVFNAASMSVSRFCARVVGMYESSYCIE